VLSQGPVSLGRLLRTCSEHVTCIELGEQWALNTLRKCALTCEAQTQPHTVCEQCAQMYKDMFSMFSHWTWSANPTSP